MPSILANFIIPPLAVPYMWVVLFPLTLLVLFGCEYAVYHRFLVHPMGHEAMLVMLVLVNVLSWLCGCVVTWFPFTLSLGVEKYQGDHGNLWYRPGPAYSTWMIWGYVLALGLSIIIEFGGAYLYSRLAGLKLPRLLLCVVLANLASYAGIGVVILIQNWLMK